MTTTTTHCTDVDPETGMRYPYTCALCLETCQPALPERVHTEAGAPMCNPCYTLLSGLRNDWTNTPDDPDLLALIQRVERRMLDAAFTETHPRKHWAEHLRTIDKARVKWGMWLPEKRS